MSVLKRKFGEIINTGLWEDSPIDEFSEDDIKQLLINRNCWFKGNREEMIKQGMPEELVKKLYYSKNNTLHDFDTENKFYLVKILSDNEIKYDETKYSQTNENINKIYGIDNFNQLMVRLNKEFPTKINKEKINELIDRFQY